MTRFSPRGLSRAVGLAFAATNLAALVAGPTYADQPAGDEERQAAPPPAAATWQTPPHADYDARGIASKTVLAPDGKSILWEFTDHPVGSSRPRTRIRMWESSRPPIYRRLASAFTGNTSQSPAPRYLTRPDDDAFDPRFTPGQDGVSFRAARGDGAATQVWVLSLRGGEGEAWTRSPTDVEAYAWASDGSLSASSAPRRRRISWAPTARSQSPLARPSTSSTSSSGEISCTNLTKPFVCACPSRP
jgi:hypothetical protein